jgi:uncharacterized protein YqgC (DUF456 family)
MHLHLHLDTVTLLSGLAIIIGIFGTVIPHVPGLLLSWAGVLAWSLLSDEAGGWRWPILALATVLAFGGTIMKYAGPLRHLSKQGVPALTVFIGGVGAVIGFFVIPVLGLFLGFVVGVLIAESIRLEGNGVWASAWKAVKAVGLSVLIEVGTGLVILLTWLAAVLFA